MTNLASESIKTGLISRGINATLDFFNNTLDYSLSEVQHGLYDPSGYLQEQANKWDFNDTSSPLNPQYHSSKSKKPNAPKALPAYSKTSSKNIYK